MLKFVVFDYGNTLFWFRPLEISQAFIGDAESAREFCEVFFDRVYWDRIDAGTISDEEWFDSAASRLSGKYRTVMPKVAAGWQYVLPAVEGMDSLVRELHAKGVKLYLLSNISKSFAEHAHEIELLKFFDGLVMSAEVGLSKPSPDIYRYLLEKYSLDASEGIFVDDLQQNIEAGEKQGIRGYLFDGDAEKLRKYFYEMLEKQSTD